MAEFGDRYRVGQILPHHAEAMRKRAEARTGISYNLGSITGSMHENHSPAEDFYREYREECPLDTTEVELRLASRIGDVDRVTMDLLREGHLGKRARQVLSPLEEAARKKVMARFKAGRRANADIRAQADEAERIKMITEQPQERTAEPVLVLA